MPQGRYLTERDYGELKELIRDYRSRIDNLERNIKPDDKFPPNEVYFARLPDGEGIDERLGTIPGTAELEIYKLEFVSPGQPIEIIPAFLGTTTEPVLETVYNVHRLPIIPVTNILCIDREYYIPIHRDKYGHWLADTPKYPTLLGYTVAGLAGGAYSLTDGTDYVLWDGDPVLGSAYGEFPVPSVFSWVDVPPDVYIEITWVQSGEGFWYWHAKPLHMSIATSTWAKVRLNAKLKTSDASQASCEVLEWWGDNDPGADVEVFNMELDYSGLYKYSGDANAVAYVLYNGYADEWRLIAVEGDGKRCCLWRNDSGATAPVGGILRETGVANLDNSHTNTRTIITCAKPSTTFTASYWVNGDATVANGAIGICWSTESPCEALIDSSGGITNHHGVGPVPGQWYLKVGFPLFRVIGIVNAGANILLVRQIGMPIFYAVTTGSITAGATTDYVIATGTFGSETDSTWVVPTARAHSNLTASTTCLLVGVNNGWELVSLPGGSGSSGSLVVRFTLDADFAIGDESVAAHIQLWDGDSFEDYTGITVWDFTGTWSAPSGYPGFAVYMPDSDTYEILWLQSRAKNILFRFDSKMDTNSPTASGCEVAAYWNGPNPGSTVSVANVQTDFSGVYLFHAEANALGFAEWNDIENEYVITRVENDYLRWILCKNNAGETIPSGGCVQEVPSGRMTMENGGHSNSRPVLAVQKPSSTWTPGCYWIAGASIPDGAYGLVCSVDGPMVALVEGSSLADNVSLGPVPGSFELGTGYPGYRFIGYTDEGDPYYALVEEDHSDSLLAVTEEILFVGASASAYLTFNDGVTPLTGYDNILVYASNLVIDTFAIKKSTVKIDYIQRAYIVTQCYGGMFPWYLF